MTASALGVIWLGQSTFIYQFPTGLVVCVDPYLSYATSSGGTRERLTPILTPPSMLRADVVVTTHDHTDHFDEHSLRPIAERPDTVFVGPSSCCEHWQAMKLPPGEHKITLHNAQFNIRESFNVTIQAGETVTVIKDLLTKE